MAARVYSPSIKSSDHVPNGCSSLQFGIYFSEDSQPRNSQKVIVEVINSLEKMQIASSEDIVVSDYREIEFGNIVFYEGMIKKRDQIKSYFTKNDIHLIGRFGEWDYLWSDQSLLSSKNVIIEILGGLYERNNRYADL